MVDTACPPRSMTSTHEPVATVAGQIRRRLRALLTGWGVARDTVDDALLVVEELVANVLDHARTRVPAERRGGPIPFEPVIDVPADAGAYERLAGWLGRDPAPWQ